MSGQRVLRLVEKLEPPKDSVGAADRLRELQARELREAQRQVIRALDLPPRDLAVLRERKVIQTDAIAGASVCGREPGALIVVLMGDVGRGKTLAAVKWLIDWILDPASWSWENIDTPRLTGSACFTTARRIASAMRDNQQQGAMRRAIERSTRLVVDEMAAEFMGDSTWLQGVFDEFVGERYAYLRPTVLCTNVRTREEFEKRYLKRVSSRMAHAAKYVECTGPDLRKGTP